MGIEHLETNVKLYFIVLGEISCDNIFGKQAGCGDFLEFAIIMSLAGVAILRVATNTLIQLSL